MAFAPALPHGPITPVTEDVYCVRGLFQMGPGFRISRTMTIVKLGTQLVIMNSIRLTEEGEAELAKLGQVSHVVKLSDSHGIDEPYYADRFKPEVWVLKGSKTAKVKATQTLGPDTPIPGSKVLSFPGTAGFVECALWIPRGGGTLVTCDALQNHVDTEGASFVAKLMTPVMGFKGGLIVASMWRMTQKVKGPAVKAAFSEVLPLSYANIVTGHGPPIVGNADTSVRSAVDRASV